MMNNNNEFLDGMSFKSFLESRDIDFIDFGCSKGGSLAFAKRRLGGRNGLGIDIDQAKIEAARAGGYETINYKIQDIPDEKLVRFVILSHFLEHVPCPCDIKDFVRKAVTVSNEFVYIQQPYLDADTYLFERGLKLYWSDWHRHPNRMTSLELWLLLRDLKNEGLPITFSMHVDQPIIDSSAPAIHPLASPIDQHEYSPDLHPPKGPVITFENNVYRQLVCLITLPGCDHAELLEKI